MVHKRTRYQTGIVRLHLVPSMSSIGPNVKTSGLPPILAQAGPRPGLRSQESGGWVSGSAAARKSKLSTQDGLEKIERARQEYSRFANCTDMAHSARSDKEGKWVWDQGLDMIKGMWACCGEPHGVPSVHDRRVVRPCIACRIISSLSL